MKRAVMIIADQDFRDEELLAPKQILEKKGVEVKVASSSLSQARGVLGTVIKPDLVFSDIKAADFEAIIFIGGSGSEYYWDNPLAQKIAQDALKENKIIGAICSASVTLAKAGILKGRKATVWPEDSAWLTANQAIYTAKIVERDGNIITANGPGASKEFGEELVKALGL